jgi:hypothetical protein
VVPGGQGRLVALRPKDGAIAAAAPLDGPGQRFIRPALVGDRIYVSSCDADRGPGHLEAYQVVAQ